MSARTRVEYTALPFAPPPTVAIAAPELADTLASTTITAVPAAPAVAERIVFEE